MRKDTIYIDISAIYGLDITLEFVILRNWGKAKILAGFLDNEDALFWIDTVCGRNDEELAIKIKESLEEIIYTKDKFEIFLNVISFHDDYDFNDYTKACAYVNRNLFV